HKQEQSSTLLLTSKCLFLTVTHSLKYFYTASSGIENFPSYVSVGLVDDVQISYCDSRTNENIPKQDWMDELSSEHPNYWKEETLTCRVKQQTFKYNLEIAKLRFNKTGVSHIVCVNYHVISCFATGFYPNRAEMFWRKDGEEIHDDVEKGEILPNNDGTFQMSIYLDLSSVPPEDWTRYQYSVKANSLLLHLNEDKLKNTCYVAPNGIKLQGSVKTPKRSDDD
uniref:Immunoglobulin C1-set domain-containing protein n=1 Tax=Xiphophorus couchianus TaxID=32473 RepID=A0A3B5KXI6_9TELE